MNPAPAHRAGDTVGLVRRYVDAGISDNGRKCRRLATARFTALFGDLAGWQRASTAQRLQAPVEVRSFVAFAAVQARIAVDAEYVVRSASKWGALQADLDPLTAAAFRAEAISLGFIERESDTMWAKLSQIAVIAGSTAALLTPDHYARARDAFTDAVRERWDGCPSRQPPHCSVWMRCCFTAGKLTSPTLTDDRWPPPPTRSTGTTSPPTRRTSRRPPAATSLSSTSACVPRASRSWTPPSVSSLVYSSPSTPRSPASLMSAASTSSTTRPG